MTLIIRMKPNARTTTIEQEVKDIKYQGKIIEVLDLRECTANKPWVEIKFKGEQKRWIELVERVLPKGL